MMAAVVVLLAAFAVVMFIQFGALVEMFHQLRQVRLYLEMVDKPTPLDLGVSMNATPGSVGLPSALDRADFALILFLSDKCGTCHTLAESLRTQGMPSIVWLVMEPTSGDASSFIELYQLRDRLVVDDGEHIAARLGLTITPAAIAVEHGRMVRAQTVPSVRQLHAAMPTAAPARTLAPLEPVGVTEEG